MESEVFPQDPSPPDLVPADENCNVTLKSGDGNIDDDTTENEFDVQDNMEMVIGNSQNNNTNGGTEICTISSMGKAELSEKDMKESDETKTFEMKSDVSDVVVDIDDAISENSNHNIQDFKPGEVTNDEGTSSGEYNDFCGEYGEAVADGYGFGENANLPQSFVMPLDPTLGEYGEDSGSDFMTEATQPEPLPFETNKPEREDGCGQESDGNVHLDDLVVQSLAGSVAMNGIDGIFYDNEATNGEGMSYVLDGELASAEIDHGYGEIASESVHIYRDFGSSETSHTFGDVASAESDHTYCNIASSENDHTFTGLVSAKGDHTYRDLTSPDMPESDHTYNQMPTITARGIYGETGELLGFSNMDAGESPATGSDLTEDIDAPCGRGLVTGSDDSPGKPYSCDPMNVVCDQLLEIQLQDDQTVPTVVETGPLDDSVSSQNDDASLMQQLHDALEDDRMVDMKRVIERMDPDIRRDEASWLRLYDVLEKHHQDQLMYQCQQHDRRVNQIKSQINSEINLQQDSLERRLATHKRALKKADLVSSKTSFESPTRHSSIGQLSPSKLATPTLDKYEAKVSPSHHPIPEELVETIVPETKQREGLYGTDAVTSQLPEDFGQDDLQRDERQKQKKDLLSRFDLETPVMKALSFPLYSQLGAKDSGYQSPRTRSIFKKTGTRLSDASDFVSPPLMHSKRTSLEAERSKSSQGFYEPALAEITKQWGPVTGQESLVYRATFQDDVHASHADHANKDDFYDLPEKIKLILEGKKSKEMSLPSQSDLKAYLLDENMPADPSSPREAMHEESAMNTTFTISESEEDHPHAFQPGEKSNEVSPKSPHLTNFDSPFGPTDAELAEMEGFLPGRFSSSPDRDHRTPPKSGGQEAVADRSHLSTFSMLKDNSQSPGIADCSLREELEGGEEAVAETSHISGFKLDGMDMYEPKVQALEGDITVSSSVRMCHFLQECCSGLENKVDTLQRDNHEKQRQIWQYEHKVDTLERKFNLSEIQRRTLESLVEKLNKHIKEKDEEVHMLQNDNRRMANSLEVSQRVFDDFEQMSREKRALQSQVNNVESALFTAQSDMTGLVRQISKLELENKRLTREFDTVRRNSQSSGESSQVPSSQRSPSPLIQADHQLQRLRLAAEAHQASRTNGREYGRHDANLLEVTKEDKRSITPTNNVSPPTNDTSVINAPHVKPKRRMSLGRSPRRSLGAEFETSNLLAHSRLFLREKHERALAGIDSDEMDDSGSRHSQDGTNDLDETLTKVKSGVYRSIPEYERPSGPSGKDDRRSLPYASSEDSFDGHEKPASSKSQNVTKSLFSNSIEETVQHISTLEKRFDQLQMEKRQLESALSHVGSRGPKAMTDRERLESVLDKIDKELASIRMNLKKYNVL
ncbi:uncharacterized protein LOC135482593 isoform X2 [Lineus longissimus]|uniref:uncharacterized protein LOC135482593 isoform X2 n=1 Tax=Lineus longissimus TaxID=88925 RepID=UPI00315DADF9